MALLDEEVVEYWLNNKGFFCMRGVKSGLSEIDFLAVRPHESGLECWQVEVTVSFRPIGYIGGASSAKRRDEADAELGVEQYIHKKFTSDKKIEKRNEILPNAEWKYVLVCAEVRHEIELELFKRKGIIVHRYKDILTELGDSKSQVNSIAGNIVEILRYLKSD
jgi:hypothetical protein